MNWKRFIQVAACTVLTLFAGGAEDARAQASPTAVATLRLSAFGGFSGNYTGLELAKNGDISAGVDVGFHPFAGYFPAVEVRGLYPVAKSGTVNLENLVAGLRLGRRKGPLSGYGDVLFGRAKVNFPGGYPNPDNTFLVVSNTSNVLSVGGGVDCDISDHFGIKGDVQLQRYQTPVEVTGNLYSKVFTAALVYRFGTGRLR